MLFGWMWREFVLDEISVGLQNKAVEVWLSGEEEDGNEKKKFLQQRRWRKEACDHRMSSCGIQRCHVTSRICHVTSGARPPSAPPEDTGEQLQELCFSKYCMLYEISIYTRKKQLVPFLLFVTQIEMGELIYQKFSNISQIIVILLFLQ